MDQPAQPPRFTSAIREFIQLESAGGILLLVAAIAALVAVNTPLATLYAGLVDTTIAVQVGAVAIEKPLLLWVNDGLMAVFFFLVGLEVKREFLEGELSSARQVVLPGLGAVGGMAVPAAIYAALNWHDPVALDGWGIPVATDIAFALALLSVFGRRVPPSLKVFLLTLAIFDDLAAIAIIAIFYSADLSLEALIVGVVALGVGVTLNRLRVTSITAYVLVGVVLWVAMLKSGVHATLAGVLIAFCVPTRDPEGGSPLRQLEHDLHAPVAYAILPVFAFVNAGIPLGGIGIDDMLHPVTLGITAGLFLGKPAGIVAFVGLGVLLRAVSLPDGVTWGQIIGVAWACGIGFTLSLFIAGLAFEHGSGEYYAGDRLGILIGSVASAVAAWLVLQWSLPPTRKEADEHP
ncbi:MAG: Na+/H+ antiporter NhaA [Gammaproteobacteria bacterium]|nr:Na+/H+ antiporter NhaA [Gammaproteobacteria bacterium]